jgi:glycine dehydrogenase subunit 2
MVMKREQPLLFELGAPGRRGCSLPPLDVPAKPINELLPPQMQRQDPLVLPELSEGELVRHYTALSTRNHGVDSGFYPLGSCTMKYNPKVNEEVARLPGFALLHPCQPPESVQGAMELLYRAGLYLREITGMDQITFQPAAGAHGELTGMMLIRAYHCSRNDQRKVVLAPDSSHGTNPASAAMAGYEIREVPSDERGLVDLEALRRLLNDEVAALMLTNPNTLGLFEEDILEIAAAVHGVGGLLYYDGANLNAIMGHARPGDMGFDVVHLNLHKTFATPHGGGGPGSGPVGVKEHLAPFLPVPLVEKGTEGYFWKDDLPHTIGKVHGFYGNFGVIVKAYTYMVMMGAAGLRRAAADAVLNANYLMERLKNSYALPYDRRCKHEFVISAREQKKRGVSAGDIAKALLDYGFHPPTVYFPLIVEEALMIEPTETESRETLDRFAEALEEIARLAAEDPASVLAAPHTTPVSRLDEVSAARRPRVCWTGNRKSD